MRFKLMSVLLAAVVVVAAGCGGSKKSASTTTTAATTTEATTTEAATTTSAATTQTSASKGIGSFASTKNCAQMAALGSKISQAVSGAGSESSKMQAELQGLQAMAAAAPSEIKADFQTFVGAFGDFAQALTKAGLKAGGTPTPQQLAAFEKAAKSLDTPKLRAAEQHLSAWAQKNCGVK